MLLFMDESGRTRQDDVFAVGLLIVKKPLWLQEKVQSIRAKHGYKSEFHLHKISKHKHPIYKDLLTEIFSHFDKPLAWRHFRFRTVCVLGKTGIRTYQHEHVAYNHYTEWTLRHNLKKDMKDAVLYIDKKSRYDKDALLDRLQLVADTNKPGSIKKVENLESHKSDLLQFCDILTGLVRHGMMLKHGLIHSENIQSSRGAMRTDLWQHVQRYYGRGKVVSCHEIKGKQFLQAKKKYESPKA